MELTFVVDTSKSPFARLHPVPIENVRLEDNFWAPRLKRLIEVTLPEQYKMLEESGCLSNFRRAAGKKTDKFRGPVFIDSDAYKWVEAVAFSLAQEFNERLFNLAGGVVNEIVAAQDQDGYLNTYFIFEKKKERWTNLRDMHELYCAGHLIQAGIALHRAMGDTKLLKVARRFADHILDTFGPDRRQGTCGHPEIEMALVELYRTTGEQGYLDLAKFFIDSRGKGLVGGRPYHIDHKPFRELSEIVGHAVRSLYLNCGATDVYMETGDRTLLDALLRLWHNMVERKMYITGGVGSRHEGEAIGEDYELPNMRAYAETCAAIANVMWNYRMLLATGDARFADIMELALYNGVLSGISLDGKKYFYVNPLADRGKHRRQKWFDCACCPPNIARLMASLPGYFYSISAEGIWVHLYAQSRAFINLNGEKVTLIQRTSYPWDGNIEIIIEMEKKREFSIFVRIPGWCRRSEVSVNGQILVDAAASGRYMQVKREWENGDSIKISLPMPIERMMCHPHVFENFGRVALIRGPLVYCVEQTDHGENDVWELTLPRDAHLEAKWTPNLLHGIVTIEGEALIHHFTGFEDSLYKRSEEVHERYDKTRIKAIPYHCWANREPGPMTVWIRTCA
ncbi:MAG: glycoside hydrolase family 127 protein [Nitrososphaerota archaeon]|nr:glycoside hydrolase family 127 protein [Candidatus Bathyarchaeota archaeon]MDW8049357.1 glycoside hydrolase family 127 protein [Nitrososphaerota archaeon]